MARPSLEPTLGKAAEAFDAGDFRRARDAAATALALDGSSVAAHHYLAASLAALGEVEAADRTYHEALTIAPDDVDLLLGAADLLLGELGDDPDALMESVALAARGAAVAEELGEEPLQGEFLVLQGRALTALGRAGESLPLLEQAAGVVAEPIECELARGIALYELLRLDEARAAFEAVFDAEPDEPLAHWYLGLIAERSGDDREAHRRLERARRLDPDAFGSPVLLSEDAFARAVEEALARLPERIARYLSNVAVAVEPFPLAEDLEGADPPLSPTVLGMFRGTSMREQSTEDPWSQFPSSIILYQRNLERACTSREELLEQIEITVLHEVGHYLGLDEEDLRLRGLD